MEDQMVRVKYQLAAFRIPEYKEALGRLRLPKQGKKQVLMERLLEIFKNPAEGAFGGRVQPNNMQAAMVIDEIYRKLQTAGEAAKQSKKAAMLTLPPFQMGALREDLGGGVEEAGGRIQCICGDDVDRGTTMVKCDGENCGIRQHVPCVIVEEKQGEGREPEVPKQYFCPSCRINKGDPFCVTTAHVVNVVKMRFPSNRGESPLQSVEKAFTVTRVQKDLLNQAGHEMQVWAVLINDKTLFRIHWPHYADVRINGTNIKVTNRPGQQALGANGRDDGANINLAIKEGLNRLSCSAYDSRPFAIGIRLIQRRTVPEVTATIPRKEQGESVETALARIKRCVGGGQKDAADDSDSDLEVVSDVVTVNLRCPNTGSRIKVPGRFRPCQHMGNFDLHSFIEIQQRARKWQCPICLVNYSLEHLIVDPVFYHITDEMKDYGEDITDIEMRPDAWWRPKLESKVKPPWRSPFGGPAQLAALVKPEPIPVKPEPFQDMGETSNAGRSLKFGMKRDADGMWKVSGTSSAAEPVANGWSGDESTKRQRSDGNTSARSAHSHDVSLEDLLHDEGAGVRRLNGGNGPWGEGGEAVDGGAAEDLLSGGALMEEQQWTQIDSKRPAAEPSRETVGTAPRAAAMEHPNLIVLSESEDEGDDEDDVIVTGNTNRGAQQDEGQSSGDMSSETGRCRVRTMGAGAIRPRGPAPALKHAGEGHSADSGLNVATAHIQNEFFPDPRVTERPSAQDHALPAPPGVPGGAPSISSSGGGGHDGSAHVRGDNMLRTSSGHEVMERPQAHSLVAESTGQTVQGGGRVKTMGFGALGGGRGSGERVRTMGLGAGPGPGPTTGTTSSGGVHGGGGVRTMGFGSKYKPPRPREVIGGSNDMQESPLGGGWHMAQRVSADRNASTSGGPDAHVGHGIPNGAMHGTSSVQTGAGGTFRRQSTAGVLVGTTSGQPAGSNLIRSTLQPPAPRLNINGPHPHAASLQGIPCYSGGFLPSSSSMPRPRTPLSSAGATVPPSASGCVNGVLGSHAPEGSERGGVPFDGNLAQQHFQAEAEVPSMTNGYGSSHEAGIDISSERGMATGDNDWSYSGDFRDPNARRWRPVSCSSDIDSMVTWSSEVDAARGTIQNHAGVPALNSGMQMHDAHGNAERGSSQQFGWHQQDGRYEAT